MKKDRFKKIRLQRNVRIVLIVFLCIIILFSLSTAYGAYQEPTVTTEAVVTYEYTQNGIFDFTINLKNNSWYNKTTIKPGQVTIFKKIVDSINASFTYIYHGDEPAETTGEYYLLAQVKTDLWEKDHVIVSKSNFSSNKNKASFTIYFPINITYYENVVTEIDDELGVKSKNPTLTLKCNIVISSETSKGFIYKLFSPSANISLGGNILEFEGNLLQSDFGVLTREEQVFLQSVINKRNMWSALSVIFFVIIVCFVLVTKNITGKFDKMEKSFNKIKKKYGKRIIEVEKIPVINDIKTTSVKSIDDLLKISVELGNPVIHYRSSSKPDCKHVFYLIEESMKYEYILADEKK